MSKQHKSNFDLEKEISFLSDISLRKYFRETIFKQDQTQSDQNQDLAYIREKFLDAELQLTESFIKGAMKIAYEHQCLRDENNNPFEFINNHGYFTNYLIRYLPKIAK